jgi:ATP-binding cassette, subfamily B, bacterial PglK
MKQQALDVETEIEISKAIHTLRRVTTVIMVAHSLSRVRAANIVVYMDNGDAVANCTFEEVRGSVPDFDRQAKIVGL